MQLEITNFNWLYLQGLLSSLAIVCLTLRFHGLPLIYYLWCISLFDVDILAKHFSRTKYWHNTNMPLKTGGLTILVIGMIFDGDGVMHLLKWIFFMVIYSHHNISLLGIIALDDNIVKLECGKTLVFVCTCSFTSIALLT